MPWRGFFPLLLRWRTDCSTEEHSVDGRIADGILRYSKPIAKGPIASLHKRQKGKKGRRKTAPISAPRVSRVIQRLYPEGHCGRCHMPLAIERPLPHSSPWPATRFTCTRCWLRTFCKLCLSEELNNLIDRAVTALYPRVEPIPSRNVHVAR